MRQRTEGKRMLWCTSPHTSGHLYAGLGGCTNAGPGTCGCVYVSVHMRVRTSVSVCVLLILARICCWKHRAPGHHAHARTHTLTRSHTHAHACACVCAAWPHATAVQTAALWPTPISTASAGVCVCPGLCACGLITRHHLVGSLAQPAHSPSCKAPS